jgi:hypothetical protein
MEMDSNVRSRIDPLSEDKDRIKAVAKNREIARVALAPATDG